MRCARPGRSSSASRAPGRPSGSSWRPACAIAATTSPHVLLPQGEAAKRLDVIETAARELATMRVERGDALVAVGGGALGDAAGFLAAIYLRGIRFIQVPTTLVAQIDSAIGGKTGVDLPEGKNLVGAFHQPAAIVVDVDALRTLPERQMRAALGEAVKMAALGDERLFERLEADGAGDRAGRSGGLRSGGSPRSSNGPRWAKVEVVVADERERDPTGGRLTLNLGHSLGHAVEAAAGYGGLLHGEAVAYGLRAATRIGVEIGVTPPERAGRIGALLDAAGSRDEPLPYPLAAVMDHLATDKKHAAGRLRWVLPTADGVRRPRRRRRRRSSSAPRRRCWPPRAGAPDDDASSSSRARTSTCVGTREPEIYGHESLDEIHAGIAARAAELGLDVDFFQSNHEGALIDRLHQRDFDVAIVNAGGLTHTSVALRDALLGGRSGRSSRSTCPIRPGASRSARSTSSTTSRSSRSSGRAPRGYHLALESIARRFARRRWLTGAAARSRRPSCDGCAGGSTRSTGGSSRCSTSAPISPARPGGPRPRPGAGRSATPSASARSCSG